MAIKIKKKDGKTDDQPLDAADADVPAGVALSEEADPFLRASWGTASWVEENRGMVIGGVILVFVAVLGGYMGLGFLEAQKVEASSSLSPAFDNYNTLLEGSKELEMLKSTPELKVPDKTFASNEERWQAVYDNSNAALAKHPAGEIADAAKLTKAAAAMELKKYDEAIKLYTEYRASSSDEAMKTVALQGLATVYASSEKWDEATKTLDELAAIDGYESAARYEKARVLERAGKADAAKTLYHEILDAEPNHPSKSDIERRLANM